MDFNTRKKMVCECGKNFVRTGNRQTRCSKCQKVVNYQNQRRAKLNYLPKRKDILSHMKDSDYAMTLQEVADELGISRERVRQIEYGAIMKLRRFRRELGYVVL